MADVVEFGVVVKTQSFSCSGIILDGKNGLILTVGSIANGAVNNATSEVDESNSIGAVKLNLPEKIKVDVIVRKACKNSKLNASDDNFLTLHGSIIAIWRDKRMYELQKKMFPEGEWTFENGKMDEKENCENSNLNEQSNSELSLADFALIEVKDLANYTDRRLYLSDLKAQTGIPLSIVGTPFGSECYPLFFNSLSKGIVSNTIGPSSEIIFTDARCVPGSEGCLVLIQPSQHHLVHLPSSVTYQALNDGMLPYGIVIAPFCWRSGEWIGLTLVCSISYILRNFLESSILSPSHPSRQVIRNLLCPVLSQRATLASTSFESNLRTTETLTSTSMMHPKESSMSRTLNSKLHSRGIKTCVSVESKPCQCDLIQNALKSVVLVQAGTTWGSGIIIDTDKGLVITCRHILIEGGVLNSLNPLKKSFVPIVIHDKSCQSIYRNVDVLFVTEKDCPLDFALLRVKNSNFQSAIEMDNNFNMLTKSIGANISNVLKKDLLVRSSDVLTNDPYLDSPNVLTKGTHVFTVGYSTFGHKTSTQPCVTAGVISNISLGNGSPVMMQTSAAVHCGGSGGAVISKHSGQLLGMVTCNVKDSNSSVSFPHVNFSIPVNVIHKLVDLSMCNDESNRDRELSKLVSGFERVWCLDMKQPVKSKL